MLISIHDQHTQCTCSHFGMVWYGMVYVDLYSAIVANVSNALGTLVLGKQPSFQALFEGAKVLLREVLT